MRHAWFLVLAACGGAPPPPPATVPRADPVAKVQRVNSILSLSTACWLGRDEGKCKELIVLADGKENPEELAPLAAIDGNVTREIAGKMETFARQDGMDDVKTAQKLFAAIVDAQREAAVARKAAEGIKAGPDADKVATGETVAAKDLKPTFALEALYGIDVGVYTKDAKAIALLTALDRARSAGQLPKHLKLFAVAGPYKIVFGVEPSIKMDEPRPIRPGTWLAFEMQTAAAAGHPVAGGTTDPKDQAKQAWEGILAGFADRIKASQSPDTPLADLVTSLSKK